jgi:sigma-E factor negative regulatory protein RseC
VSMLETRAIIVQVEGQYALVQAARPDTCELCTGKGCGAGRLSRLFCSKPRQFRVDNPSAAAVGDEVVISVAEGAVLRGIALVYLLPLLLLVTGALLGSVLAGRSAGDGYAVAGAFSGLAVGFIAAKWISSQSGNHFRPFIAASAAQQRYARHEAQGSSSSSNLV